MRLFEAANIKSGYTNRGRIQSSPEGAYRILQAKDIDGKSGTYEPEELTSFNPPSGRAREVLEKGEILFMAKGAHHLSFLIDTLLHPTLAAGCFFVITVKIKELSPAYLCWYLNQEPAQNYFLTNSGRGVPVPIVRKKILANIEIPLPPLEKQHKIVELDQLVREEQRLLRDLAEKRQKIVTRGSLNIAIGKNRKKALE